MNDERELCGRCAKQFTDLLSSQDILCICATANSIFLLLAAENPLL
jgi:hypothetical protein